MSNRGFEQQKKKLAIIGTVGVPGRYGGFETLAHHLVLNLNQEYDLTVYCSSLLYKKEDQLTEWNGAKLKYFPLNANGIQSIPYDIISILHALYKSDVLLILGVSGCIILPFIKLFTKKKIIVNIDGLEWRRDKWSKPVRMFLKFSESIAVKYSDADITDNAAIKRYTAIYYKTLSNLIAYGGDHCGYEKVSPKSLEIYPFLYGKYAFKVARIEPENNIHVILQAFQKYNNYPIVIVGNWNNSEYGRHLKTKYGNIPNYYLLDPIYISYDLDILRNNCYIYLHGHRAGGTNPSLVEAMSLGLPIIAFNVSYNKATTFNKALYFRTSDELLEILTTVEDNKLKSIAEEMKILAKAHYTWKLISDAYSAVIKSFDYGYIRKPIHSKYSKLDERTLIEHNIGHLKNPKHFYED